MSSEKVAGATGAGEELGAMRRTVMLVATVGALTVTGCAQGSGGGTHEPVGRLEVAVDVGA